MQAIALSSPLDVYIYIAGCALPRESDSENYDRLKRGVDVKVVCVLYI